MVWYSHLSQNFPACSGCEALEHMVVALHWDSRDEIPHIQGQRNLGKMVGAGAAASWCWSSFGEIPNIQGQRRSPSKMVGGANSHLESNPIPARDAQMTQTDLDPGPRDPRETETEQCLSITCGGTGQQWTATGTGALGAADVDMA